MPHYVASDLGFHCLPMTEVRMGLNEYREMNHMNAEVNYNI